VELALLINFNCLHLKGNFTRIVRSNLYDLLKESASRMNHLPAQPPNDQEV
jgi:hypothetical protein